MTITQYSFRGAILSNLQVLATGQAVLTQAARVAVPTPHSNLASHNYFTRHAEKVQHSQLPWCRGTNLRGRDSKRLADKSQKAFISTYWGRICIGCASHPWLFCTVSTETLQSSACDDFKTGKQNWRCCACSRPAVCELMQSTTLWLLFSSFRRVSIVICSFLSNSPASEF